jgi:hypothetical protein
MGHVTGIDPVPTLDVTTAGWRVTLDHRQDLFESRRDIINRAGYSFTHVGRIQRVDGESFPTMASRPTEDALRSFLRFVAGARCGLALPVGETADGAGLSTRWGVDWVDASARTVGWHPLGEGDGLERLFAAVHDACRDPFWSTVIRRAVNYYVDANAPRPLDRAVVMAQAGLELLAWATLVRSERWIDPAQRMTTASRLRLLLKWGSIPSDIPDELPSLQAAASKVAGSGLRDGPFAVSWVRNSRVHPREENEQVTMSVLSEAWCLALSYYELVLLKILHFDGDYIDRVRSVRGPLPWA